MFQTTKQLSLADKNGQNGYLEDHPTTRSWLVTSYTSYTPTYEWPVLKPKLEVPTTYHFLRPIFQAYVRRYAPKYGQKYGTNVPPIEDPGDLPLNFGDLPLSTTKYKVVPHS